MWGWTDCFDEKALDAHGLLRPGERVKMIRRRALLYGPAINASSYLHVAMTYASMMIILCKYYKMYTPELSNPVQAIATASDFEGTPLKLLVIRQC